MTPAIDGIMQREAGFVDHPSDRGGPTKYGITLATLSQYRGYAATVAELQAMPDSTARAIYEARYILTPGFDRVQRLSPAIAHELIDTGVNMGPSVATAWLQRWLNAMNRQGRDYADIPADGALGPVTMKALRAYLDIRKAEGERVLVAALNCSQGHRYLELAEGRPPNEDFLYGWVRARVMEAA